MKVSASVNEFLFLLCDNEQPHKNAPQLQGGQEVKYLPGYSPFINPTEMTGCALKAAMKRQLSNPVQREIYDRTAPREDTLHARHMRVLRREVENCLPTITQHKCN